MNISERIKKLIDLLMIVFAGVLFGYVVHKVLTALGDIEINAFAHWGVVLVNVFFGAVFYRRFLLNSSPTPSAKDSQQES